MSNYDTKPNSVGWHILEGFPWWPVYVCDPTKLRPNLHTLGSGHKNILRKARDFPKDYGIVYFFGSHDFSSVHLKKGYTLKPWDCADKDKMLKGLPSHLVKKKASMDELLYAIQEAEDFLSMPEDIRLPPFMVPSDLDPSLEPPPPIEQADDDDSGDDDGDDADGGNDGNNDNSGDVHMSDGGSDAERRKKKKSSSSSKKKSSSSSSSSKSKDKKATKDKDKKAPKAKKDDKKRKGTTENDAAEATAAPTKASPTNKVAKHDKTADVKTATAKHKSSSKSDKSEKASNPPPPTLTGDALSAVLEKEIKWILANCQFDEMTTKTVRKLLEKRLQMDLRHHKASIKDGVARVIASMEDGTDAVLTADANGSAVTDAGVKNETTALAATAAPAGSDASIENETSTAAGLKTEAPSNSTAIAETLAAAATTTTEPVKDEAVKAETASATSENDATTADAPSDAIDDAAAHNARVAQHLQDADRDLGLALREEPKLLAALQTLEQHVPAIDRAVLNASPLLPTLVMLRAHDNERVAQHVAAIAAQWNVDDLVPAPQPVRESDILAMKEKLEDANASHDDVLACLTALAKMRLQMSHLKNTGIARVVASLRQHANDKVSITAINLRKSWIQLTKSTTDSKSDADRVKSLESMNRVLEQKDSADDSSESSHLAVLEKLQSMTLSTEDIIRSKIGVVVSKLRKSPNEKVAKAATQLRKKWKTEAAA